MTNTRILSALCHPTCSDVIPGPPPSPSNGQTRDRILSRSLPLCQPIGRQDGGSVPLRQPIGTQDGVGGAANQSIQDGGGIKVSLKSRCRGGGAVQDVQQPHLHRFSQQI